LTARGGPFALEIAVKTGVDFPPPIKRTDNVLTWLASCSIYVLNGFKGKSAVGEDSTQRAFNVVCVARDAPHRPPVFARDDRVPAPA